MEDADYFRHKAEQCRRLAGAILNQHDPAVANLLALAVEFEAKAVALAAVGGKREANRSDHSPTQINTRRHVAWLAEPETSRR